MNIIAGKGRIKSQNKYLGCQRLIFENLNTYKYGEIITFDNNSSSGNYALTIGLNPALINPQKFDATNRKVANYLRNCQNNYDGYILLNLYSVVTNNSSELCKHIKLNPMDLFNNIQNQVLNTMKNFTGDIYLFWGPNATKKRLLTNVEILSYIQQSLSIKNYYYSADSNQKFVHPGDATFLGFLKLTSIQSIL